jgi:hypothetical protein
MNSSPAPLDPQDVIALLRELADEIECEVGGQENLGAVTDVSLTSH